jgi:hypothetical protein
MSESPAAGGPLSRPLAARLDRALEECDEAICSYQAGLLDDDELRRELFRAGMVIHDDEAWLLDLVAGRWQRWDGLRLRMNQDD